MNFFPHLTARKTGHTVNNSNGPARPVNSHKHLTLGIVKHHLHNKTLEFFLPNQKVSKEIQ